MQNDSIQGGWDQWHVREMRNAYKMFVENPEGRRLLGRHRYRGDDNIKMYLKESEWGCGLH